MTEDAMLEVATKILQRGLRLRPNTPLRVAKAYVTKMALNAARDIVRRQSYDRRDDADEGVPDITDPNAFRRLDEMLPQSQVRRLMESLRRVHPRAPDYVQALLDGLSHREIADQWQVSPAYVSKWYRLHGPALQRAVRRHLTAKTIDNTTPLWESP